MVKRKEVNDKIVTWIKNKVKTEYADDISVVLIYGSYINGSANSKSDVDCYYIPKTERGYDLAIDFIIDGVGYDIFPITWERVASIADLEESLSPLVGDVEIIYYGDTSDLQQFQDLQERQKNNLLNVEYVRNIAVKRCEEANRMCAQMNMSHKASEVRKIAGSIIMLLADAVAVYNHDYYHFGLKKQFENLQNNFPDLPQSIVTDYKNVVEASDAIDVKRHAMKMFNDVCEYLDVEFNAQEASLEKGLEENKLDASWLAGLYEEIISTFNKVYVCCENEDYILAFLSAVCLQRDLDDAREAGCPEYDLLSDFNYAELGNLAEQTQEIENDFLQLIIKNGGKIKKYDSFEQFERAKI